MFIYAKFLLSSNFVDLHWNSLLLVEWRWHVIHRLLAPHPVKVESLLVLKIDNHVSHVGGLSTILSFLQLLSLKQHSCLPHNQFNHRLSSLSRFSSHCTSIGNGIWNKIVAGLFVYFRHSILKSLSEQLFI